MYKCLFCGMGNPSEKARFCTECGPEGPSLSWSQGEVDCGDKVDQYASIFSEFYFDTHSEMEIEKFSLHLRERFKISYGTHSEVLARFSTQKKTIAHLSNFRFEFNENVTDAFAGHDTFLDFRYTNLSEDDAFKVSLLWDDPETTDRVDLRTETKSFVKPLSSLTIGGSAVFDRIGIKEISDLQITITDRLGESANFRAESFRFKVANHEQRITNNISTHNQISIEGRGVVDATGMGADKRDVQQSINYQPSWKQLGFNYLPDANTRSLVGDLTATGMSAVELKNGDIQAFGMPSTLTESIPISAAKRSTQLRDIEVRIPDIGDCWLEVIDLLVNTGDKIQKNQAVITIKSEKGSIEIPSSDSGVVKELRVKLGDKVTEGSLVLLLEASKTDNNFVTQTEDYYPPISIYIPSTRQYKKFICQAEFSDILDEIKSKAKYWHFLIGGAKSVPKSIIRDHIINDYYFNKIRSTSGDVLSCPIDLAAIVIQLGLMDLLEIESLDELLSKEEVSNLLYHVLVNFKIPGITIGEGDAARTISLDLVPFCSISYCKDINNITPYFLDIFDCCFMLEQ